MAFFNLLSYAVALLYASGAVLGFSGVLLRGNALCRSLSLALTMAAFGLHSCLVLRLLVASPFTTLHGGDFLQLLSWCTVLVWWISWLALRHSFLGLTMAPLGMLLYIAAMGVDSGMPAGMGPVFAALHMGALFISFGLLALGFGAALLFLHMERRIKSKTSFSAFDWELPPLAVFDAINKWVVASGFALYTLGLASGFIWARVSWGRAVSWDPKEILSMLVWLLFAVLFHQRVALGWQGRKAAQLLIAIFVLSLLSVMGVNFFMESHHSFGSVQAIGR